MRVASEASVRRRLEGARDVAAIQKIELERERVEGLLDSGQRIYGFTTLLGHLDRYEASTESQEELLRAHLVGRDWPMPSAWARILLDVKIAQLNVGGSGIHPDTYRSLLDARALTSEAWAGAWTASYGSGDVVPGAWFVESLRHHAGLELKHRGDLIALINGNFVSTALSIIAARRYEEVLSRAISFIESVSGAADSQVQLPVTLRDLDPLTRANDAATSRLWEALDGRLSRPAANPLFVERDGMLVALSQSSFLDFTLTGALSQASQTVAQAGAYAKAVLRRHGERRQKIEQTLVQPTKIAQVHLDRIAATALPTSFELGESEGTEDVGDRSLQTAVVLIRALAELDAILELGGADPVEGEQSIADVTQAVLEHLTA